MRLDVLRLSVVSPALLIAYSLRAYGCYVSERNILKNIVDTTIPEVVCAVVDILFLFCVSAIYCFDSNCWIDYLISYTS